MVTNMDTCLAKLIEVLHLPSDFQWRTKQIDCLQSIWDKKDLVAILPTAYGKSLIFQSTPFLCTLRDQEEVTDVTKSIIVISPPNSTMVDQFNKLSKRGIKACALDYTSKSAWTFMYSDDVEDFDHTENRNGDVISEIALKEIPDNYHLIYSHPESLISTKRGRSLLSKLKSSVCAVAVDEAHMILEW